jgi:hypothetical protein
VPETPIYKFPSPADSDAPDGPAQLKALAEALEATAWKPANISTGAVVNAALEMAVPTSGLIHLGLGTGTVKKIAAGKNGQLLVIYFAAAVKVENGAGNIVLAQVGNFTAATGEVLILVYNEAASAWVEVERAIPDASVTEGKLGTGVVSRAKVASGSFKTARFETATIGANESSLVTILWGSKFADTNYTVSVMPEVGVGSTSAAIVVKRLESKEAGQIKVLVKNEDAGEAHKATLHAMAWHD